MQFRIRLAHLYPNLMNLYGDRGNLLCLRRRCESRQIGLVEDSITVGDRFDPAQYDLVFVGGGQDREMARIAADLAEKGPALRAAIDDGLPALAVCGGFQLFGRRYQAGDGTDLPGIGVFDMETVHPGAGSKRCIGNIVADWEGHRIVGFENHGGRTYLRGNTRPLARVVAGFGNNGEDGGEGARYRNAFGTYLHGSLLPKNPEFADRLLGLALEQKYGEPVALAPLDDDLEEQAHDDAVTIAIRGHARRRAARIPSRIGRIARWAGLVDAR